MFIGVLFILVNCEDKQSRQKNSHPIVDSLSSKDIPVKKSTTAEKQRKFPKLTDKNAMEFFLEYEKENKEN